MSSTRQFNDGLPSDAQPERLLLISILKVAREDWDCLQSHPDRVFCDRSHEVCCRGSFFISGKEELVTFFYSDWFYVICQELDREPDDSRRKLTEPWCLD